jgi:5-hydroxyisourate hydrolase-like protein (transthyretin family)
MPFTMKKNDTRPIFRAQLLQTDPADENLSIPVDLTAATAVRFLMKKDATLKVDGVATVENAAQGRVYYTWIPADTNESGNFNVEFEVSWGTDKQTFPSDAYMTVTIMDDLG